MASRRPLRRAFALLAGAVGLGGAAAVAAGFAIPAMRIEASDALDHLVLGGMVAAGGVLGLAVWVFFRLDQRLVRPLAQLSHRLELAATESEPPSSSLSDPGLMRPVAEATEAVVTALAEARHARDRATEEATARLQAQRRRLEAVLRDLQEGVVVCAADGRILLYNPFAAALLEDDDALGLGRPVDRLLTPEPLAHAVERLQGRRAKGEAHPTTTAVCGACNGRRTLQCRVALLPENHDTPAGYILSLSDVTAAISENAERDRLLREALETVRRLTSGLHATLEMLTADPGMDAETRTAFQQAAAQDAARLAEAAGAFAERAEGMAAGHWPLAEISSEDIADSAIPMIRAEAGIEVGTEGEPVLLRSDGSSLVQLDRKSVV